MVDLTSGSGGANDAAAGASEAIRVIAGIEKRDVVGTGFRARTGTMSGLAITGENRGRTPVILRRYQAPRYGRSK